MRRSSSSSCSCVPWRRCMNVCGAADPSVPPPCARCSLEAGAGSSKPAVGCSGDGGEVQQGRERGGRRERGARSEEGEGKGKRTSTLPVGTTRGLCPSGGRCGMLEPFLDSDADADDDESVVDLRGRVGVSPLLRVGGGGRGVVRPTFCAGMQEGGESERVRGRKERGERDRGAGSEGGHLPARVGPTRGTRPGSRHRKGSVSVLFLELQRAPSG